MRLDLPRGRLARAIGRYVRLRGVDRVVRVIYSPDRRERSSIVTQTVAWDGTRYLIDTRSFLEWSVYVYGGYEENVQQVMRRSLGPGDVAVDCGANVGLHACMMARHVGPDGLVIAIEPVVELADRMARNCELNGLGNVVILRKGASSATRLGSIFASRAGSANQAQASVHPRPELSPHPRLVELERLDDLLAAQGIVRLRLVKIDVEGHEVEVLRGAEESIRRWRPHVLFEWDARTYHAAGSSWSQASDLLERSGYELFQLGHGGMRPLVDAVPTRSCMVAALPFPAAESGRRGDARRFA